MSEKLNDLIAILLDESARIDEKDDAIMILGSLQDVGAIEPLIKIAADNKQDYLLKSSAGEAIARIMIELNIFNKDYLKNLSDDAKNEAVSLLLAKKPEWKNQIEKLFLGS